MFKHIFIHEIKYWLKKPVFYIYVLIFSAIAFLSLVGSAGLFDPPTSSTKIQRLVNSPFEINYMLQYFGKVLFFLLPAIIGATIYKDYKNNAHSVMYSFPITKGHYIFGKFLSALLLVCFIAFTIGLAMIIAEQFPGLDKNKLGVFNINGYIQTLFIFIIPNLIFFGAIVFAVVTYYRNIYAGFIAVIILFFLQNIIENAFSGFFIGLFDPFGQNAVAYDTQYWTLNDKNTKLIPVFGIVIYNRLFWLTLSSIIFGFTYKRFQFSEQSISSFFIKRKKKSEIKAHFSDFLDIQLPKVGYIHSNLQQLKNAWTLSNVKFKTIAKSRMFYLIVGFGILAVLFAIGKITNNSDMIILPVTNIVLSIPAFFFTTIIMLLTFIYSGMLVHKDTSTNMNQLVDATPISDFSLMASKVIAIIKMQGLLLAVMMLTGICIQIYNGYYHFEIGLYLFHLFVVQYIGLIIWAFTSVFVHAIFKNTYVGIFILLLCWFGISGLEQIGISTRLLLFNFSEPMQYSDLNAYAHQLQGYLIVKSYWFTFSLLLLVIAYIIWFRGLSQSFKERLQLAKLRLNKPLYSLVSLLLVIFITLGFTIYSEEHKSEERSTKARNIAFNKFEKDYEKYATIETQPKITDINLVIDIYPETTNLNITGTYILVNKSVVAIDTLMIKTGFDEISEFNINRPSEIIDEDTYVNFYVLKLNKALQPNDSIALHFEFKNKANTLFENNSNVLNNGTFFKNDILPRIGYFLNANRKFPNDSTAVNRHYYSQDSDLIHLKTTISTSSNQTAIAPGYLKKKWVENDRNYFEYETNSKIKNSLSFSSGAFTIEKELYKGVNLELFYHKSHTYNLSKMKDGMKAALDYNQTYFGDYQYKEARIIEFPITEGTYASVMANSIPTSEMRFIANSSQETVDISFYTIAHELTHQWFGNQVVPADAFGAVIISESITEYISLNIYKEAFGEHKAMQFLKLQRDRYLNGRTSETENEPPLYLVKGEQQYLAYAKGAMAFNTLSHYLGKKKLHTVLKDFINDYKNKEAPYPTSLQLLDRIYNRTPDSLQYLITDYFKTVTFNDVKVNQAEVSNLKANNFQVIIDFDFTKYRNEDKHTVLGLNDYLEIGFYNSNEELITIEQILVTQKNTKLIFNLYEKPSKIILDPNLLLIEKDIDNNIYKL